MNKFDALLDVALQTLLARFEELLLIRADFAEDVVRFFGTGGLENISCVSILGFRTLRHTPSSTGTEK